MKMQQRNEGETTVRDVESHYIVFEVEGQGTRGKLTHYSQCNKESDIELMARA